MGLKECMRMFDAFIILIDRTGPEPSECLIKSLISRPLFRPLSSAGAHHSRLQRQNYVSTLSPNMQRVRQFFSRGLCAPAQVLPCCWQDMHNDKKLMPVKANEDLETASAKRTQTNNQN